VEASLLAKALCQAAHRTLGATATLINADTYFGRFDLLLACHTL